MHLRARQNEKIKIFPLDSNPTPSANPVPVNNDAVFVRFRLSHASPLQNRIRNSSGTPRGSAVPGRCRGVKHFQRPHGGCAPGFHPQFVEHFLHVLFHGGLGDAEDGGDVRIRLALGQPEQRFGGTRRKAEREQWFERGEVRLEFALRLPFGSAQARFNRPDKVGIGDRLG